MASIVIVTKQCYLLCESINYIAINEVNDDEDAAVGFFDSPNKRGRKVKGRKKKPTKKQLDAWKRQQYQIIIDFVPANGINPNNSNQLRKSGSDSTTVGIKVTGRDTCLDLFAHMVEQIREQIPDNKFLDDIVEKFIQETREDGPTA
jgi:hypothetical protein